jgi:hypothetical protein
MTGGVPFKPDGTGIAVAERISIDQVLANDPAFSGDVPVRSLQLAADDRGQQFFMRILSYATAGAPDSDAQLTAIHSWYNEQLAAFLRTLRDTPDSDGRSLLDNTLVVSWSEIRKGTHTFDNLPIQLFGGGGGRLTGGRLMRYPDHTTNDLWLTIAQAFGQDMTTFGDAERCTGPLPDLFAPA